MLFSRLPTGGNIELQYRLTPLALIMHSTWISCVIESSYWNVYFNIDYRIQILQFFLQETNLWKSVINMCFECSCSNFFKGGMNCVPLGNKLYSLSFILQRHVSALNFQLNFLLMLLTSTITSHTQDMIVQAMCINWLVHNLANLLHAFNLKRPVSYGLSGGQNLKPYTEWRPLTATIWSRTAPFFRSWLLKRSSGNSCIAEERRKCQSQCTSMLRKRGQTRECLGFKSLILNSLVLLFHPTNFTHHQPKINK